MVTGGGSVPRDSGPRALSAAQKLRKLRNGQSTRLHVARYDVRLSMHRTSPFLLSVAVLLAAWGCASVPPPHPSEEVRASLGRIGITSGTSLPPGLWDTPAKGGAAGAGRGAAVGATFLLRGCSGDGCTGALLLAPLGAVIGSIYGATAAEPAAGVEKAEAAIKSAFAELQLPDTLRDRVFQVAREETCRTFVSGDKVAGSAMERVSSERGAGAMDTALEISVRDYGTKAAWSINPPVHLFLTAQVRMLRGTAGRVLDSRTFTWMSPGRPFSAWGSVEGKPVREELERGVQYLAERIVEVVFLLRSFPWPSREAEGRRLSGDPQQPTQCGQGDEDGARP